MPRTPSTKRPAPSARSQQAAAGPAPRRNPEPSRLAADPLFPFARTAEDDELRDMSGYGWGV